MFGEEIKRLRKSRGMTLRAVGSNPARHATKSLENPLIFGAFAFSSAWKKRQNATQIVRKMRVKRGSKNGPRRSGGFNHSAGLSPSGGVFG